MQLAKAENELLKGEDKIAEKRLLDILKEEPENWEAIKNISLLYIKNKHYTQALPILKKHFLFHLHYKTGSNMKSFILQDFVRKT